MTIDVPSPAGAPFSTSDSFAPQNEMDADRRSRIPCGGSGIPAQGAGPSRTPSFNPSAAR